MSPGSASGLLLVWQAQSTSLGRYPGDIRARWLNFSPLLTQNLATLWRKLTSSACSFDLYLQFVTTGEDRNVVPPVKRVSFGSALPLNNRQVQSLHSASICLSINPLHFSPLVMNTPRYLTSPTWGSNTPPTKRGHFTLYRPRKALLVFYYIWQIKL